MNDIIDPKTYAASLKKLQPRERTMYMALTCMAVVPEGTNQKYETIRIFYDWLRTSAAMYLQQEQQYPRHESMTEVNDCNCRLRSNLMLLEALPPSEGEDKGELFRLYDQARRSLIEGVQRETSFILKEAA